MLSKVFNEKTKELYLYNEKGELIFKRWINHGYSKWFDVATYEGRKAIDVGCNGHNYYPLSHKEIIERMSKV